MKSNNVKASIYLDTRRIKKNGLSPVKLKITFKRTRKYYATTYELNEEDWAGSQRQNIRGELRKIKLALQEIEIKAQACCEKMSEFTFSKFEEDFFPKRVDTIDLKAAYKYHLAELEAKESFGTYDNYNSSMVSIIKFKPNAKLNDITPEFLKDYEQNILNEGKSISTVGFYLRPLRAIINRAIVKGMVKQDDYPFAKGKYTIPGSKNIKKALTTDEIKLIINYPAVKGSSKEMYKDLWLFSFFCNGMNVADICHLRNKNLQEGLISYQRQKTIKTYKANPKFIRVKITNSVQTIIDKWSQPGLLPPDYLFPFLDHKLTAKDKKKRTKEITHNINDAFKIIAKELSISKKITTYTARHSYATILKNKGASTQFISEMLGHSPVSVTDNYLDGFDIGTLEQYAIESENALI